MASNTDGISSLLARARTQALAEGRQVLAVHTERVPALDPLACLENLTHAAARDSWLARHTNPVRMYWSRPSDRFAIAGAGATAVFAPAGPDRFDAVDREWSALLDSAIGHGEGRGIPGVGAVLMGGSAFDAEGARESPWESFPDTYFFVPRMLLTSAGDACWITISAIVNADGNPDIDFESLSRLRNAAMEAAVQPPAEVEYLTAAHARAAANVSFSSQLVTSNWIEMVARAVNEIRGGLLDKVVLARAVRATAHEQLDPFAIVRELHAAFQNAFVFGCWRGQDAFVGASPERLVRLDGRNVKVSSLAGTTPRGATQVEDATAGQRLLESAKDLSEHAVVRNFVVSALADISDDVNAPHEPTLLSLPHVHHLHTEFRARLRPGYSLLDIVERLHPTPAVGGFPRDEALRFIRERENLDRGWYAGPIGWTGAHCGEFAVALRSALVSGSEAVLFAGCGIVADSDPEQELAESELKLKSIESAISSSTSRTTAQHFADSAELA